MVGHVQRLRVLHLVGEYGGVRLAVWVGQISGLFSHSTRPPSRRTLHNRGGVVWLVVGGARLVRAGGGVPFRGADRRRTNRWCLPLTLQRTYHTHSKA